MSSSLCGGRRKTAPILSIALFLSLLAGLLAATGGVSSAQPRPTAPTIAVRGDLTGRQLFIGERLVLERAGSHFGRPALSPDGRLLAISVTPTGTETDGYAQLLLFAVADGELLATLAGHSPAWQEDSRTLSLENRAGRLLYDVARGRAMADPAAIAQQSTIPALPVGPGDAPEYPQTIRVAHHPENGCRNVPAWQVDVIPFEEYVARSVPAEVPVSWGMEALAAQAVAARTYAWYQIRQGRATYDVTDWANFQMMCDQRYPASDQAVAMTAGQYLSYQGDSSHGPIIAMYSAMNSHPTLDNPAVPYLRAVPDPTGLGEARWGHGYGLSQWGAARRANAGQSYRQILGHYYTAVYLQNGLDPNQPIAGLLGPTPNSYLPAGGLRWRTLTPFTQPQGQVVVSSSSGLTRTRQITSTQSISYTEVITHSDGVTETVTLTETATVTETIFETTPVTLPGSGVWQQPLELPDGAQVEVALFLGENRQESISLWVDRTPPAPPGLEAPAATDSPTITLRTLSPAGALLGLSNGWRWEGESLLRTANSGAAVDDPAASGGFALEARAGQHSPGDWYGPYTTLLPPGVSYRAVFRLRMGHHPARSADGLLPDQPIARLDVADRQGNVRLGLRDIWASDFAGADVYADVPVDFHIFEPADGLEFRVKWYGEVTLALDSVGVWQLQKGDGEQSRSWRLGNGSSPVVEAVAFDGAANASTTVSVTVQMVDDGPPVFGPISGPGGWQTALPITLTTTVRDRVSGLDAGSAALLLGEQPRPARLENPGNPWAEQRLWATLEDGHEPLADGEYTARFRIADQAGTAAFSPEMPVRIDRTPPEMQAGATLTDGQPVSSTHGWFAGPVLVQIDAADATSGLFGVAYVLDGAPFVMYDGPFPLEGEGWHVVRYWAQDMAGNYRYSEYFRAGIDRTPPTVWARGVLSGTSHWQVLWGGDDAHAGLAGFRAEMRRDGGEWEALTPDADGRSATVEAVDGAGVEIRVQAVDRVGNVSEWAVVAPGALVQIFLPTVEGQ